MTTSPKHPTAAHGVADAPLDLLGLVCESLPSGLVVFDATLNVVFRNQAAELLLPGDRDVSKALSRLAVESTYVDWEAELRKVLATGRSQRFDITVQSDDQSRMFLTLAMAPLRAADSAEPVGGFLVVDDVTLQIGIERRLAVSERLAAVGKLAARVTHELNNPLDGVLRYTKLAIRRVGDDDAKTAEYLEKARSGIVRMGEIITALLEFSRATPGAFEQATINKIVEDAIVAMEGRARESQVTVVCNFHQTDMPVVRGSSLFQVFCNLIKNAIDAMPDSGTLTVTTAMVDSEVVVTFEDTGVGLPEEADKIFEPFFTTKEPGKGTGLGLAVCKELIDKYEGTITAARRESRGTILTVRIPERNCATPPLKRSLRS